MVVCLNKIPLWFEIIKNHWMRLSRLHHIIEKINQYFYSLGYNLSKNQFTF